MLGDRLGEREHDRHPDAVAPAVADVLIMWLVLPGSAIVVKFTVGAGRAAAGTGGGHLRRIPRGVLQRLCRYPTRPVRPKGTAHLGARGGVGQLTAAFPPLFDVAASAFLCEPDFPQAETARTARGATARA